MLGVTKCQQELKRLREVLIKLREEETKLKEKQGNEDRIKDLFEEQRRLRQEQRKLRIEEAILVPQRKAFYEEHNIPLEEDERKKLNNSNFTNAESGSNYEGVNGNIYNNNDVGTMTRCVMVVSTTHMDIMRGRLREFRVNTTMVRGREIVKASPG
jgi:hypothetical protein